MISGCITIDTIAARLRELADAEEIRVEEKALRYVAKAADGSMRDALSLLDQCVAFHYRAVFLPMTMCWRCLAQ